MSHYCQVRCVHLGMVSRGRVVRGWFMVSRGWLMVGRSWLMVGRGGCVVGSGLMVSRGRVIRGRGRLVGSRLVGSRVSFAVSVVGLLGLLVVADLALVLDVGVVRFVLVHVVVDDLGAAVGQKDLVLSLDSLAVTLLVLGVHIGVAVLIVAVYVISVSVRGMGIMLLVVGVRGVVRSRAAWCTGAGAW